MAHVTTARSNEAWLAGLSAGDPQCLLELRAYICRCLEGVLAGKAGQADVDDFAQMGMARVLASLDRFRGESRFTTWASAIAIRIAFTELRRKRWGDKSLDALLESGAAPAAALASGQAGQATQSAREELLAALREGIAQALTERQRTIVLAELQGMPTVVLAEQLGMTAGAAYKGYHDARKKLRRYLEERGFAVDDVRFALDGAPKQHD